jgi:signal transduction histidine kinase
MREARTELTERWRERLVARAQPSPAHILPSGDLLDHAPILIDGIADFLEHPRDVDTTDVPIVAKAMQLGALRFDQGVDLSEVLKEYEILGGVLQTFWASAVAGRNRPSSPEDLLTCSHRLFRVIAAIERVTSAHYVRMLRARVAEREECLRRFGAMITHELKNRVGATLGAGQLLREDWLATEERARFAGMVEANAREIQKVLENLSALSKIDDVSGLSAIRPAR